MEEIVFIIIVLLLIGTSLLIVPIWTLIRTYTLERRLGERMRAMSEEIKSLKATLTKKIEPPPEKNFEKPVRAPAEPKTSPQNVEKPAESKRSEPKPSIPVPPSAPSPPPTPSPLEGLVQHKRDIREKELAAAVSSVSSNEPAPREKPSTRPAPPAPAREKTVFEPRPPTALERAGKEFEKNATTILGKIWTWIVVGEEHRRKDVPIEVAVATTWLLRVSIIIILTGISFGLKYSIDNDYINEWGRVTLAIAAGVGLLIWGVKLSGKKYHLIAQGLIGGGVATLYFAVFAAFGRYHLLDALPAFALMILITVVAGGVSVRLDSLLAAIVGVIGGYLTPLLIASGARNLFGLYSYMLLLGFGTLYIARHKNWKLLNGLAFLATWLLFLASLAEAYRSSDFPIAITFLILFFLQFASIPVINNLIHRERSTMLTLGGMTLNTAIVFVTGYNLIVDQCDKEYAAALSVGLAAFYVAQTVFFMRRQIKDRNFLVLLCGFSSFAITVTAPILLSKEWLSAAWSVQALVFLWMALRLRSHFLRVVAYLVYLLAVAKVFLGGGLGVGVSATAWHAYMSGLLARLLNLGMLTASIGGGYWLLKRRQPETPNDAPYVVKRENDVGEVLSRGVATTVFLSAGFAALFVFLHLELYSFARILFPPMRPPLLTILWVAAVLLFVHLHAKTAKTIFLTLAWAFTAGLLIKLAIDMNFWNFRVPGAYFRCSGGGYGLVPAIMRVLDAVPAIAVFAFAWRIFGGGSKSHAKEATKIFGFLTLCLLFLYSTLELGTLLKFQAPGFRAGGISILWGWFALGLLLAGLIHDNKAMRFTGLGLFLVTAGKVFFVDLANLSQALRVVAFVAFGFIMLGGSFLYIRFGDKLKTINER